jgi:hypothetical protein
LSQMKFYLFLLFLLRLVTRVFLSLLQWTRRQLGVIWGSTIIFSCKFSVNLFNHSTWSNIHV